MFTVKSAYHIGRVLKEDARGQCSNAARMPDIWRDLWNLKIPSKVKLFAWRACQNLLPTRDNLYKRKVIQDPVCPCCGLEVETIIHSLWSCSAAKDVWGDNLSCFQKCSSSQISFLLLLDSCFRIYDKEKVELLLVVARNIWLRRNSLLFEGCFLAPRRIWEEFISFLEDYRNSLQEEENVNKVLNSVAHLGPQVWHPPPTGHFKINWDASLDLRRNCISVGLMVGDSMGECIGAKCSCLFVEGDSRIAESLATLHAVLFSKSLELRDVIF
jgi:hypothetical protein